MPRRADTGWASASTRSRKSAGRPWASERPPVFQAVLPGGSAQPRDVHQAGLRRLIDQEIEIAAIPILAMQDRSEHARIAGTVACHLPSDVCAVRTERFLSLIHI